jgi:hypothetical protein
MRHWRKILLALIALAGLAFVVVLWVRPELTVEEEPRQLVEGIDNEELKKLLCELGAVRLRFSWWLGPDREFFIFNHRREIRELGFDPEWKDDRYILKNIGTGEEVDPFHMDKAEGHRSTKKAEEDVEVREAIVNAFTTIYMGYGLFSNVYERQLDGLHLVARPGGFFFRKSRFPFVKDVQREDHKIEIEELFMLNAALVYNGGVLFGPNFNDVHRSEEHLRERGYIMKRRGDGYVPVLLETGTIPKFPPREIFVDETLHRINDSEDVIDPALRRIPWNTEFGFFGPRPIWVEKELLDLYGVEIRWNDSEEQYELVE